MIRVSIAGGSGYAGGELLRLLLSHPNVEVKQATSQKFVGWNVSTIHPNLRQATNLKFSALEDLTECDVLFLCLPNGESMKHIHTFKKIASKIIDTGADFRLKNLDTYNQWYGDHLEPTLLHDFTYGITEIHRDDIKKSNYVSCAGCEATVSILSLYPLVREGAVDTSKNIIIDAKMGSSAAGSKASLSSHHPERSGSVRSFKPTAHRHTAEIEQELKLHDSSILISATSIEMVRGILVTIHLFLQETITEKDIWKIYRKYYGDEPFIRIVKETKGIYKFPEPKIVSGTNFCDIGFELDTRANRLVVIGAIDNLVKGTSGQAVQAFNVMCGFPERLGLEFIGLHPI